MTARGTASRARRGHISHVQQLHATDCGAACITMVLRFLGRQVSIDDVREHLDAGRDGVSALHLLDSAHRFGLRGRAVRLDVPDLVHLERGAILHWRMNHFVVLDGVRRRGVGIVDPAVGRRLVPPDEFRRCFTGVAVLLEPSEDFVRTSAGPSRVWPYARRILRQSGLIGRVLVTSAFAQLLALALPVLTGTVVDRVVPRGDADLLLVISAGIAGVAVFTFVTSFLRAHLLLLLRTTLDVRMSLDFLEHLLRLPFAYFQRRRTGDLLLRLESNAAIRETLTSTAMSALLDGALVVVYLGVLLFTHLTLGLLVVALGALRVTVYWFARRRYRDLMTESLQAQAESSSYQVQMLDGVESLKVAGAERRALGHWSHLFMDVMNVTIRRGRLSAVVDSALGAFASASPLVLLGYGAHLVLQGDLSLGTMLAMNALAAGFLGPLSSLVSTALGLQQVGSYVERVDDVLRAEPERAGRRVRPAPRLEGGVRLESVSFRYSQHGPWALRGIDLEIPAGTQVGIVGPTGCGKSTLARLLIGLHDPTRGRILFDGEDAAGFELGSFRRQVGFVPQAPFLFAASLHANVTMEDPGVPRERIREAGRIAHVHHEIDRLPLGYDTAVAQGGATLSGGQRQRIAIARAVLRTPALLILDEATSHLDSLTEEQVHANLAGLETTRIVIAHRLGTVIASDQIIVLDQGRVVQRGSHQALMRTEGLYADMFRAQSRWTGGSP